MGISQHDRRGGPMGLVNGRVDGHSSNAFVCDCFAAGQHQWSLLFSDHTPAAPFPRLPLCTLCCAERWVAQRHEVGAHV
jgi:hypothetical protein